MYNTALVMQVNIVLPNKCTFPHAVPVVQQSIAEKTLSALIRTIFFLHSCKKLQLTHYSNVDNYYRTSSVKCYFRQSDTVSLIDCMI